MAVRINFNVACNTDLDTIRLNLKKSMKYNQCRIRYDYEQVLKKPPCAIVGGGSSAKLHLDTLRNWDGDIFAVNDTAGFLSDNGISSYLYSIDCSRYPYKIGSLVKGAVLASRCHRKQFNQFDKKDIRMFDLGEDAPGGTCGGPTGVCRAPMQFLRMGYRALVYFGCDGSFDRFDNTHVSGTQKVAHENMMIVRVNNIDYLTNASLTVQSEYLSKTIRKHPQYLINMSGGLLQAMIDHPDEWVVVAVTEDLKKDVEKKGTVYFPNKYKPQEHVIWEQSQQMS